MLQLESKFFKIEKVGRPLIKQLSSLLTFYKEWSKDTTYDEDYEDLMSDYNVDEEREQLWLNKLDKQERYVMGIRISVKKDESEYNKVLEQAQKDNERLGYGNRDEEWNKKEYNVTLTKLRRKKKEQEIKQKSFKNIRNYKKG